MSENRSVSEWLERLQGGDPDAVQLLWERYFVRVTQLAGSKLPRARRRDVDEEDIALSAFESLCRGAMEGRFPRLEGRDNLWALLVVIVARKARGVTRARARLRRGGGRVFGESILADASYEGAGLADALAVEPTEEEALLLADEIDHLLSILPDEGMREIVQMRLEGLEHAEIAVRIGCAVRTVERRLALVRRLWAERSEAGE